MSSSPVKYWTGATTDSFNLPQLYSEISIIKQKKGNITIKHYGQFFQIESQSPISVVRQLGFGRLTLRRGYSYQKLFIVISLYILYEYVLITMVYLERRV